MVNLEAWRELKATLDTKGVTLVAVSKTKPTEDIQTLYNAGQRDFGENYVQELTDKEHMLPADIRWHFIGHLQSNKVKYIAPFVHLIHAVDNYKLLVEINKQAIKYDRVIDVLLQMHIAREETKFGMDEAEVNDVVQHYLDGPFSNVRICGLMGMASFTDNRDEVRQEFGVLRNNFNRLSTTLLAGRAEFSTCSMGMTADYQTAIACGSNMVRIGSMLFGSR